MRLTGERSRIDAAWVDLETQGVALRRFVPEEPYRPSWSRDWLWYSEPVRSLVLLLACSMALACNNGSGGASEASETSGTSGTGSTAAPVGTTYEEPDACMGSDDCEEGLVCVAAYDAGISERGPAACVAQCVVADDLGRWCLDDAACCEGLVCNEVDGFCRDKIGGTTTGSQTGTDSGSGTDSGTGTETGTGTGTGTG